MRVPPPPSIGDRFSGPARSERERGRGPFGGVYHVRAVIDVIEDKSGCAVEYQVVLRRYSDRRGWVYSIESELAFVPLGGDRALFEPVPSGKR